MALVVFDRGTRIKTPVSSIFPPRRVEASGSAPAESAIPFGPDSPRAEYEQAIGDFTRLAESAEHRTAAKAYHAQEHQSQQNIILARQIMSTPVISCDIHLPVRDALSQMQNAAIHYLAVFDDETELTGIVSQQYLLAKPSLAQADVGAGLQQKFLAAAPTTPVIEIASSILQYHVGAVLVIDAQDQLCGIITRTDLIRLLISRARVEGWA
jgi:acetoin utilization protein AcuB